MKSRKQERGVTYIEMVATTAILMILAAAILPMVGLARRRAKEMELRSALREIRMAIDTYRLYCEVGVTSPNTKKIEPCSPPFPKKLEDLVEGKAYIGDASGAKFKALRKIPTDPMNGDKAEWNLRAYEDDFENGCTSTSSMQQDVWDVHSKSKRRALDGTRYCEW